MQDSGYSADEALRVNGNRFPRAVSCILNPLITAQYNQSTKNSQALISGSSNRKNSPSQRQARV